MCNGTKIEILPPVNTTKQKMVPPPPPKSPGGSSSLVTSKAGNSSTQPAFNGAKFDRQGFCLKHTSVQLAQPMKDDDGKLIYQELKISCPTCQSLKYKAKKSTSLGGGKVRQGHRVHGAPPTSSSSSNGQHGGGSRSRSKSRERGSSERGRDRSLSRSQSGRSASKSRERNSSSNSNSKPQRHKHEYDTPFDSKGRCHYHKNVQLAAKKMTGGWKMLHSSCPKCMEDSFEMPSNSSTSKGISRGSSSGSARGDAGDDRSVRSSSSRRGGGGGEHANGQFDKNGCCVLHTHVQVAKKSVFGKFKVVRACPACDGHDVGGDDISVSSKKSTRSNSSRKSTRSAKSSASRGRPGKASKSGRYGALPFDADGYCCRHPNIQLAKKKTLGGFKIMHAECPECMADDTGSRSSRRSKSSNGRRRKSSNGTGRVFDDSGSETSSYKSGKSTGSKSGRKKRIRVRNLKTEDEEGKIGRYSGDVNDEHVPHGNGVMKYVDGSIFDGVWNEGSKVHGKTKSGNGGGVGSSMKKKDSKGKA